jgi:hypothetical protein
MVLGLGLLTALPGGPYSLLWIRSSWALLLQELGPEWQHTGFLCTSKEHATSAIP